MGKVFAYCSCKVSNDKFTLYLYLFQFSQERSPFDRSVSPNKRPLIFANHINLDTHAYNTRIRSINLLISSVFKFVTSKS